MVSQVITELKNTIHLWDCLEVMKSIPDGSIDAIIADIPYWTTACKWDTVIPFEPMWKELKRIIKPNGAIVLFWSEPFSSALRMSNIKQYKYDWIWDKPKWSWFLNAKNRPMRHYETISIFSCWKPVYYPQWLKKWIFNNSRPALEKSPTLYWKQKQHKKSEFTNYPKDILQFSKPHKPVHPTQKPVALLEYLIKTYSLEDDIILDFTSGSWTTWIAAQNTNRNYILIEKDEWYYNIIKQRLWV